MHVARQQRWVAKSLLAVLFIQFTVVLLGATHVAHADTTTPQLTARWTFDGVAAHTDAPDSVGVNVAVPGGSDGASPQPSTDVPPVSYPNSASMEFDGSNYFTIDNPVAKNFTICSWIKTASTGGGVDHWTSAPIMDSEVGGVAYDFGFGIGNGGKLMFGNGGVYPGDDPTDTSAYWDEQINGATTVNDNTWHNVCVTRNGDTGEDILYVDAQIDGSGFSGIGTQTQNAKARIGWGYDGAALYQGLIDDVRVYNGVLTQSQLQNLTDGSDDPDIAPGDDGDNIDAAIENGAPNSGDANDDGVQDGTQPNVSSFVNTVTTKYSTIATDDGCALSDVQSQASGAVATDGQYSYPVGLINFKAHCASTQVKLYFYDPPAGDFVLRKFINGQYQNITGATMARTTIGGQSVIVATYTLTDGGALDADGIVNGTITDPVGLATATTDSTPSGDNQSETLAETGDNALLAVMAACILVAGSGVLAVNLRRLQ